MKLGLNTNKNNRATQSLSPPKRGEGDNLRARENIPSPRLGGEKFPLNITSRIDLLNRSRRRESALTFIGLKVRGLTSAATRFRKRVSRSDE
jgi:hypothetical protein